MTHVTRSRLCMATLCGALAGVTLAAGACSSSDPATQASAGSTSAAGSVGGPGGAPNAEAGSAGSADPGSSGSPSAAAGSAGSPPAAAAGSDGASAGSAGSGGSGSGSDGSGSSAGSPGSSGAGGAVGGLKKFSFFVTSMAAMLKLAPPSGFGGNLTFGQADGLAGADKICSTIAETSLPGSSVKQWRAFLSTSKVNAADRIGPGPWYDFTGRLVASSLTTLLQTRPTDANAMIKEDLPNETGLPNHRPDPTKPADDNHHVLTGSNSQGKLYGPTATCKDWTTNEKNNTVTGRPRIGFSWSIQNRIDWISGQDEGGCGAGVAVGEGNGGSDPSNPIVGSGGGYGAIYCFALTP